jgi:NTE family protein
VVNDGYPSLAQIAGHALSNIFLDSLAVDVERLERVNRTLSLLPDDALAHTPLRPIEVLVIAPSQRLDDIAGRHLHALPPAVRTMLRGVGVTGEGQGAKGSALASYLLFESDYTRELIALGQRDAMARSHEVRAFFGWPEAGDQPGERGNVPCEIRAATPNDRPPASRLRPSPAAPVC